MFHAGQLGYRAPFVSNGTLLFAIKGNQTGLVRLIRNNVSSSSVKVALVALFDAPTDKPDKTWTQDVCFNLHHEDLYFTATLEGAQAVADQWYKNTSAPSLMPAEMPAAYLYYVARYIHGECESAARVAALLGGAVPERVV